MKRLAFLVLLTLALALAASVPVLAAADSIMTTLAGNGASDFMGDVGPATSASLSFPTGVAVDAAGNVFIADRNHHSVRRIDAATKFITTVAGNGSAGYSGDGGLATGAGLAYPTGVAVDAAGNLFIADRDNSRIRRVDAATKFITTVAGYGSSGYKGDDGLATSAYLAYPTGVAVDAAGNVFIADRNNHRIRRVDIATGIITTVAGNGGAGYSGDDGPATTAELYCPSGVAVDAAGNLSIADTYNNRIRRVDAATGTITTVAGNGSVGYSGDGGSATSAGLAYPTGVAVDAAGNLFITDNSSRIRRVDAVTGLITTYAGNGSAGYGGDNGPATGAEINKPFGLALDCAGGILIADTMNNRIRQVIAPTLPPVPDTVQITVTPATPAGLGLLIRQEAAARRVASNLETSLMAKVDAAQAALDKGKVNASMVAINHLEALINQIEAQTGKKIALEAATAIAEKALAVIAALGD